MSVVSASDIDSVDNLTSDDTDSNTVLLGSDDSDVLSDSDGSFIDLNDTISSSTDSVITLNRNYTFNNETDSGLVNGIVINRTLTIDGNGFTINAANGARIFTVTAGNVVLKNIRFINGYSTDNGGAILWSADNGIVKESTFINNTGDYGGAIRWDGSNGQVMDSFFYNNTASTNAGGGIYWGGSNTSLVNSVFVNNTAYTWCGAVNLRVDGLISDCIFRYNRAVTRGGGAVGLDSANTIVRNSQFINNTANTFAGAMFSGGSVVTDNNLFINCSFINNTAGTYGGAIYNDGGDALSVYNSTFVNNKAGVSGDAFATSSGLSVYLDPSNNFNGDSVDTGDAILLEDRDFYVSPEGGGYGTSPDDACDWIYALAKIASGNKIIFQPGIYIGIVGQTITKTLTLVGNGAVIDLNGTGGAFIATVSNIIIDNFTFINGSGTVITWTGDYGILNNTNIINSTIVNANGAGISWSGSYGTIANSKFTANTLISNSTDGFYGGAALYWSGAYGNLVNSIFSDNLINASVYRAGGAAVRWTGINGTVKKSTFTNNKIIHLYDYGYGGAIYWEGVNGTVSDSQFNNNYANTVNDVYYTTNLTLKNNVFKGEYIKVNDKVSRGHEDAYVKITAPNGEIQVSIILDGSVVNTVTVNANSTGNVPISFGTVSLRDYVLNVSFTSVDDNTYVNTLVRSVSVLSGSSTIYVSDMGGGSGNTMSSPTNMVDALSRAVWGTNIVLVDSVFTSFVNQVIDVSGITIRGFTSNVVVNGQNNNSIFIVTGDNVVISDLTFVNANSTNSAGAIYWLGNNGVVSNSKFINNTGGSGGALRWIADNCTISNSEFVNNTAVYGGALHSVGVNNTVSGSVFVQNVATNEGGSLMWHSSNSTIKDCVFVNNTARGNCAGGIYIASSSFNTSVSGCSFMGNVAGSGAAICVWTSSHFTGIFDCNFTGNFARGNGGGALFCNGGQNCTVMGCSFVNNSASGQSGALFWAGANVIIDDCSFSNNGAGSYAGAVCVTGVNATIINCDFVNNTANTYGGAVLFNSVNGVISNSKFINNTAATYSGAFHTKSANVTICGSTFIANKAMSGTSPVGFGGGASNGIVVNCTFRDNYANGNGGAITMKDINNSVSNCIFINNTAVSGGAIYWLGVNGTVKNSGFINNTAVIGGAIYWNALNGTVNNSKFINNTATGQGNDIYNNNVNVTLISNSFTGDYICLSGDNIALGSNKTNYLKSTALNKDITATFTITGSDSRQFSVVVSANSTANHAFYLPVLSEGDYTISVTYNDLVDGNTIVCSVVKRFTIIKSVYYVSADGTEDGQSSEHPTNWAYALDNSVAGTTIYLIGDFNNIVGLTIDEAVTIIGNGAVLDANRNGGIFTVNADNVVIEGISFVNTYYGIAINWYGWNGVVRDCIFANNYAYQAPAIYVHAGGMLIDSCVFENNTADGIYSGAVVCWVDGAVTNIAYSLNVVNSNFTNNHDLNGYGGALYTDFYNSNIVGCNFVNNNAGTYGGALVVAADSSSVVDCIFVNNTVGSYGGALTFSGAGGSLVGCSFVNNSAGSYGGAVSWSSSNSRILNCNFTGNNASGDRGGALNLVAGYNNVSVGYCTFNGNHAKLRGGAIFSDAMYSIIFNSSFVNNSVYAVSGSYLWGGAVDLNRENVTLVNSTFINNSAPYGGAVKVANVNCTIANNMFINNTGTKFSNDVYTSLTDSAAVFIPVNVTLSGNSFTGDYIDLGGDVINKGLNRANSLKVTALNSNITARFTIKNSNNDLVSSFDVVVVNGTVGDTSFYLPDLAEGNYTIQFTLTGVDGNTYTNNAFKNFMIIDLVFYVHNGSIGAGTSSDPTTLEDALNRSSMGTRIIMLNGDYILNNTLVDKEVSIIGSDNTIITPYNNCVGFTVTASNVVFNNLMFINAKLTKDWRSVIMWSGSHGQIINCVFKNNTGVRPTCLYMQGSNCSMINCSFDNNTATSNQACIRWEGHDGFMSGCNFTNGRANNQGAFYWSGRNAVILDCNFINNTANGDNSGAVDLNSANALVANCTFINNNVPLGYGGAIRFESSARSTVIVNCTFRDNTAGTNGGGIYVGASSITIKDSIFEGNRADYGGAVYWASTGGNLINCNFTDNYAFSESHDVYLSSGNNAVLINNIFKGSYVVERFVLPNGTLSVAATSNSRDMSVRAYINNTLHSRDTISAYQVGNTLFSLSGLSSGVYTVNLTFITPGNNKYINRASQLVVCDTVYVSTIGGGSGFTRDNSASWEDVMSYKVENLTVVLLEGEYYNIIGYTISNSVSICGEGRVVLNAKNNGRFFTVSADNVLLDNLTFINGYYAGNGGALYWTGSNGSLINCNFIGNNATRGSAVYTTNGVNASVVNCTFTNNYASAGSTFENRMHNTFVCDCIFKDNIAVNFAGGLYSNANITVVSCNFINNTISTSTTNSQNGGALYLNNENAVFNLSYCNFVNNSAYLGGAINLQNGNLIVDYCNFTNNTARGTHGGALHLLSSGDRNITNSNFLNNKAPSGAGGAIISYNAGKCTILNCTFINGLAASSSGGVNFQSGVNHTVAYCKFINNFVSRDTNTVYGAAIYWAGSYGNLSYCVFENNSNAHSNSNHHIYGGAVYFISVNGTVNYCNFTNNHANNTVYHVYGGALYVSGAGIKVSYCNFNGNYAETLSNRMIFGSALFLNLGSNVVEFCNFTSNYGLTGGYGGALYVASSSTGSIVRFCNFDGNNATTDGGAIAWQGASGSLVNSTFINNTAQGQCNDVYKAKNDLTVCNNTFIGSYWFINGSFVEGYRPEFTLKVTSSNSDVVASLMNDGVKLIDFVIDANTIGNSKFSIADVKAGNYSNAYLIFTSVDGNMYKDNGIFAFDVFESVFYINASGTGLGKTRGDPTNWTYAYSNALNGSKIIFLKDNYNAFVNVVVDKMLYLIGESRDDCILNGKNNRFFTINSDYTLCENLTFVSGVVSGVNGGALLWEGSYGYLKDCTFRDNSARYGAVAFDGGNCVVDGCNFTGNHATQCGAIWINPANVNYLYIITNSVFDKNYVNNTQNAWAAAVYAKSPVNISYCNFTNNYAISTTTTYSNNGATIVDVASSARDSVVCYCNFVNNSVSSNLNTNIVSIVCWVTSNGEIFACNFTDNSATRFGAVYWSGADGRIIDSNFINNSADINGGGVYWIGDNGLINNSRFYNNSAVNGSALYTTKDICISNSVFLDNKADSQPIVYVVGENNISVYFSGNDNYLNAIYSTVDLTQFVNVTYWGGKNLTNSDDNLFVKGGAGGQIISLNLTNKIIGKNKVIYALTDEWGNVLFDGIEAGSYSAIVSHPDDTYYTSSVSDVFNWTITASFTDLQNLINNVAVNGGVVNLTANYVFDPIKDIDLEGGITISNDALTINGNGVTLDAADSARIFKITANNVVLDNLTLVNGNGLCGGAVYWNASGGSVKRSKFFNNTAVNGSAIYATSDILSIEDSVFADNLAVNNFTYTADEDGNFTVCSNSGDNFINTIYAPDVLSWVNVSYWGANGLTNTGGGVLDGVSGHNLTFVVADKVSNETKFTMSNVTTSVGAVGIYGVKGYYSVFVRDFVGPSRFNSFLFELPVHVKVTDLVLVVPDVISVGDNLTVVAVVNSNAHGNVSFTINGSVYNVSVVGGRAILSVNPGLAVGEYNIDALFVSDGSNDFADQMNSSAFTVKVKTSPSVTIIAPETVANNTILSISAKLNFIAPTELQLVVRLQHFFNHTFFTKIF